MKIFRRVTRVALAGLLALAATFPAGGSAVSGPTASLSRPLRFAEPVALGAVQARRVDVAAGVPGGAVVVSGGEVAGASGAVPPGASVSVWWQGVEVGRASAAADGSFRAEVPVLPGGRYSVVYGDALPDLGLLADVGLLVPGEDRGTASADKSYSGCPPQCAFDGYFAYPYGGATPYGDGRWNAGDRLVHWVSRDLGKDWLLEEVWLWHGGEVSQARRDGVYLAADGEAFGPAPDVSLERTCTETYAFGDATFVHRFPEPVKARQVKVVSDQGTDTTGDRTELREVALMARLPAGDLAAAPGWSLPEGPGFSAAPVPLVKPAGWSGHNPPNWPDPDAWWVWTRAGANQEAPFGLARFRVPVEVGERTPAGVCLAADDRVSVWLDGHRLFAWDRPGYYAAVPVVFPPGRHVLAFEVENGGNVKGYYANPAGLLVTVRSLSGAVLARSGGPGWQAGDVCPEWADPNSPAPGGQVKLLAKVAAPDAWRVWVEPGTTSNAPAGEVGFRAEFEVAEAVAGTLEVTADDRVAVWLDGVLVGGAYGGNLASIPVRLAPGRHVLALHGANAVYGSTNPGWVVAALKDASGRVLLRTGDPCWSSTGYLRYY